MDHLRLRCLQIKRVVLKGIDSKHGAAFVEVAKPDESIRDVSIGPMPRMTAEVDHVCWTPVEWPNLTKMRKQPVLGHHVPAVEDGQRTLAPCAPDMRHDERVGIE